MGDGPAAGGVHPGTSEQPGSIGAPMTDEARAVMGWIAAGVTILAYPPYIVEFVGGWTKTHPLTRWMWTRLGLKGGTKPHQVSWLIWGTLQLVILLSSWEQGASATTWIVLMYLIGTSSIGLLSLKYGESSWTPLSTSRARSWA